MRQFIVTRSLDIATGKPFGKPIRWTVDAQVTYDPEGGGRIWLRRRSDKPGPLHFAKTMREILPDGRLAWNGVPLAEVIDSGWEPQPIN